MMTIFSIPRHVLALAVLALAVGGCGAPATADRDQEANGEIRADPLPDPFADTFDVSGTGDRDSLWITITGSDDGRGSRLRAATYSLALDGTWAQVGAAIPGISGNSEVFSALNGHSPCLGFGGADGPTVSCFDKRRWKKLPRARDFKDGILTGLRSINGQLHALVVKDRFRVARVLRLYLGSWRRVGPALPSKGTLVAFTSGGGSRVELTTARQTVSGQRSVLRLVRGRWRASVPPLGNAGLGPLLSGAVRDHGRIYLPVIAARGDDWPFSVYVRDSGAWRRLGSRALNRGPGSAQGTLGVAANSLWATWQQHEQRRDGGFDTKVYIARVNGERARVEAPRLLWAGVSIGPGDATVVEGYGRAWALYVTGKADALRPAVALQP